MLKGKWKLLICIALVTCVIFTASNSVFAAINEGYLSDMPAVDASIDEKISSSPLLSAIGLLIYGVGSLMELLMGKVFELITGTNMFPWADAILFNAVPFLDANMFTASEGSLLSIIYDFLTGTYYSLLTLASTFFGIAVMFSAIKLAITAIAEDKARYKKAIVDWLLGLVMLWGMHFFISFILYLNEQLVVVASSIVSESLASAGQLIADLSDTADYNAQIVKHFVDLMEYGNITLGDILGVLVIVIGVIMLAVGIVILVAGFTLTAGAFFGCVAAIALGGVAVAAGSALTLKDTAKALVDNYVTFNNLAETFEKEKIKFSNKVKDKTIEEVKKWMFTTTDTYHYVNNASGTNRYLTYSPVDLCAGFLKSNAYKDYILEDIATDASFFTLKKSGSDTEIARVFCDAYSLVSNVKFSEIDDEESECPGYDYYKAQVYIYESIPIAERNDSNYNANRHALYKSYCELFEKYVLKETSEVNVLYNLASFFKETAWEVTDTGWSATRTNIQNAIMYVLLVCYSLVFFISYTKRLFYVIILVLMAPIVVVFDFFMKFGK